MSCDCMTETNPYDVDGPEIVLTHSSTCEEHPDFVRVATDRAEDEPCQRLTPGCCVDHRGDERCETW